MDCSRLSKFKTLGAMLKRWPIHSRLSVCKKIYMNQNINKYYSIWKTDPFNKTVLWWFPHTARSNFLHYILGLNPSSQSASKSHLEIPQSQHSTRHCSYFCCYLLDFKLRGLRMHLREIYLSRCQVILAAITKEIVSMQMLHLTASP